MNQRKRGVLLPVSSLPSPGGIGNFGPAAGQFIDLLHRTGQQIWQVLPLGPVGPSLSPYYSDSAFAGNPLLIDPQSLLAVGLSQTTAAMRPSAAACIDYPGLTALRSQQLAESYAAFAAEADHPGYESFLADNDFWLPDYSLFFALKIHFGGRAWSEWPKDAAGREGSAMAYYRRQLRREIDCCTFTQYIFWRQWAALKEAAGKKNIEIIGDLPIYVAWDSCDVWAHREFFRLNDAGRPAVVAGVPPDYFSADGQLWGNPVYDWPRLAAAGFSWWHQRIRHGLKYFDRLRLDHFRGFQSYWAVPAGAETARSGQWLPGPGAELFRSLGLAPLPFVAEDLGLITPEVIRLKESLGLPGMQVFQFAAEDGAGSLFRALGEENALFCTGTHDNDTTLGWYKSCLAAKPAVVSRLKKIFGIDPRTMSETEIVRRILAIAAAGAAARLVLPAQDLLCLDSSARMNTPGVPDGNWQWRLTSLEDLNAALLAAAD